VTRSGDEWEHILRTPPLLIIEILSPQDSLSRLKQRVADYLNFGVEHIWAIEPETRTAYIANSSGFREPADGILHVEGTPIACSLNDLWANFDRATKRVPAPPPSQST
jgi:Uma2 family endonuclease